MNVIEKATVYVKSQKDDKYTPSWLDVRESYIQGHKAAYIESVHEQHFKTSEYMPPAEPGKKYNTVWVLSAGELVYFDYNEEMWYNDHGMPTYVEIWTWPEAVPVEEEEEPEKTAHQLEQELKQLQYEKREMEKQIYEAKEMIRQLNGFRFQANEQIRQLTKTFEELLTTQFDICELRDLWRKRAGLVQKCEE